MATSRIWDEEFRQRVIKHQERRGPEWTNIEEEKELSRHQVKDCVVLIDCVTLWCTNFFFDLDADVGWERAINLKPISPRMSFCPNAGRL